MRHKIAASRASLDVFFRQGGCEARIIDAERGKNSFKPFFSYHVATNHPSVVLVPQFVVHLVKGSDKGIRIVNTLFSQVEMVVQFLQRFAGVGVIVPQRVIKVKENGFILHA